VTPDPAGREEPVSGDATAAAERFAAALDREDATVDADPDLAGEVALARALGALRPSLDPHPQARERARRRLLAALARETRDDDPAAGGPSREP
jgi:hypothetical protein